MPPLDGYLGARVKIKAQLPEAFSPLITEQARYKVFYGGRGKAASWSFGRSALILGANRPLRFLCTRELQKSIKDSIHQLLTDQIPLLGLDRHYTITDKEIRGKILPTRFVFWGVRYNISDIKSLEGIDICIVEEAEKMSRESWRVLIPTIRKDGSEFWITYNPDEESDPTHQDFVVKPRPRSIVRKVSWRDNPWFPKELREEMEYDRRVDPELAAHIWDGEFRTINDAAVLAGKWRVDAFDIPTHAQGPYDGADWGFSVDPTTRVRCWVVDRRLLIEHEVYKVGCELDDIPALFDKFPNSRSVLIRADSSRPETIAHMKKKGLKIIGAEKWPGSIEDGVSFIRSFEEIVIHERCKHTIQEAKAWSYKRDRLTNDITTEIVDKHNHTWDAVRYALQPIIRASKRSGRPSIRSL